jgi:hypothetical protein
VSSAPARGRVGWARRAIGAALDVCIVLLLAAVLVIAVSGGGTIHVAHSTIRARGAENPIWILTALVLLRYAVGDCPILGLQRWSASATLKRGIAFLIQVPSFIDARFKRPVLAVSVVALLAFAVRVFLAWRHPGFFSGDDVEIHEMTLGALLGKPWPVWNLRCPFFPMVFVYPAQWLALAMGWTSAGALVFAGRIPIALLSVASIPLVWCVAVRLAPDDRRLAALAVVLFAINKLQMSFGSSELPRPVSTVFVVGAFFYALKNTPMRSAVAGLLLGIAIALRFSEVVFVPAALVTLRGERYLARAAAFMAVAGATAAATIGVSDALYWGHPFSSVLAALDYTVVQRQSSRGYEPPWEYLRIIPAWSTYIFVALAVAGSSRRTPEAWWLWMPIGILTLLPHKEARYLLPVIPFLCIAAARGVLRLVAWPQQSGSVVGWRRWMQELATPMLVLSVLHEVGGWRLPRSDEGVRLAVHLRDTGVAGVAVQDPWRLGGRPCLATLQPIVEVAPETLSNEAALASTVRGVSAVALRSRVARTVGDRALRPYGFGRAPEWSGEDYVLYTNGQGASAR